MVQVCRVVVVHDLRFKSVFTVIIAPINQELHTQLETPAAEENKTQTFICKVFWAPSSLCTHGKEAWV